MPLLLMLPLICTAAPEPTVRLHRDTPADPLVVVVRLAPIEARALAGADRSGVLTVRVAEDAPPILGELTIADNELRFTPRFSLTPGQTYVATFTPPFADSRRDVVRLTVPEAAPRPAATVTHVYPSAARLPANLLRMYLTFSRPMTRGNAAQYIRLLDADGRPMPAPFLHLDQELWSRDGTRFTLLFDPGRIKHGLVPHAELGPPLTIGHEYTLEIDAAWPDEHGSPLRNTVRTRFTAGPPEDRPVDPSEWVVIPPAAGTHRPIIVKLPRPLDHALLGRMITVTNSAGQTVPGRITVGGGDRVVTFAPDRAWKAGRYRLVVDTRLEDVCGNQVGRPFEVDIFPAVTERIVPAYVEREFSIK